MKFNRLSREWGRTLGTELVGSPSSLWVGEVAFYRCDPPTLAWFYQTVLEYRVKALANNGMTAKGYCAMTANFKEVLRDSLWEYTESELSQYEVLCKESVKGRRLPAPLKPEKVFDSGAFRRVAC